MDRGCVLCLLGHSLGERGQACPSRSRLEALGPFSTLDFSQAWQGPASGLRGFESLGSTLLQGSGLWAFFGAGGGQPFLPLSSRRSPAGICRDHLQAGSPGERPLGKIREWGGTSRYSPGDRSRASQVHRNGQAGIVPEALGSFPGARHFLPGKVEDRRVSVTQRCPLAYSCFLAPSIYPSPFHDFFSFNLFPLL